MDEKGQIRKGSYRVFHSTILSSFPFDRKKNYAVVYDNTICNGVRHDGFHPMCAELIYTERLYDAPLPFLRERAIRAAIPIF